MDCETCKEKRKVVAQTPKDVPYIVHEGAVARLERVIKRMWVLVLLLIFQNGKPRRIVGKFLFY